MLLLYLSVFLIIPGDGFGSTFIGLACDGRGCTPKKCGPRRFGGLDRNPSSAREHSSLLDRVGGFLSLPLEAEIEEPVR
ncbi:MAG: hypothetical protein ACRYG4_25550 [Janthinobacterium lividum]